MRFLLVLILQLLTYSASSSSSRTSAAAAALVGGEKAFFTTPQMTRNVSHRQSVCDRYESFRNGTVMLEDALNGLQLHVVVENVKEGGYFNYDEETTGIDSDYPGLLAVVLDELARRGKFTWRDTFGVFGHAKTTNSTWDEVLFWGAEVYDVTVNRWAETTERMKHGVTFMESSWIDSGLVMIGKEQQQLNTDSGGTIDLWNWLNPYDLHVWMMTIFTILLSGIVYQILEWFADERDERTLWEWSLENAYLSAINFTQAYEYQPKTLASRLFGVSMAIWALVMTATYTANLASLLVDRSPSPPGPETLAEVAVGRYSVCVFESTYPDQFIKNSYEDVIRVQRPSIPAVFQGLHDGVCDFAVVPKNIWNRVRSMKVFNPQCDLFWVGRNRLVTPVEYGFASKTDSGDLCTSFIQDVLNVHMRDMVDSGFLRDASDQDDKMFQDIDCNAYKAGVSSTNTHQTITNPNNNKSRRNLLKSSSLDHHHQNHRIAVPVQGKHSRGLKAAGKGAVGAAVANAGDGAGSLSEDDRRLSAEEMMGTFVFHWGLMAIAMIIAGLNAVYVKYSNKLATNNGTTIPLSDSNATNKEMNRSTQVASSIFSEEHALEARNDFRKQQCVTMDSQFQQHLDQRLQYHEQKILAELGDLLRQEIQRLSNCSSAGQSQLGNDRMELERSESTTTTGESSLIHGEMNA